ncbi:NAD-dependent protein deacetylase sirtuin-2 [Chamberlinius hualienensis]
MAEGNSNEKDAFGDFISKDSDKDTDGNDEEIEEMDKVRQLFAKTLGLEAADKPKGEKVLDELTLKGVAAYIKDEKCKNVIVMCGAGVSTAAGIPDFRSPGSGLYDNLKDFNLPDPQAIFEISFFKTNPHPFYVLARKLLPIGFKPTLCHYFMRLLHEKNILLRVYSQNIDTLERMSGIPEEKIVEAHGTFYTSHCISCREQYSLQWMKGILKGDGTPTCKKCNNYVKPDIVFFGENLPSRFFRLMSEDFSKCDLLIVLGTSLVVQPFASLVNRVGKNTPRLLINKEKVGQADSFMSFLGLGAGLDYDSPNNYRDVAWVGTCDEGCECLAAEIGWKKELTDLVKREHDRLDNEKEPEERKKK